MAGVDSTGFTRKRFTQIQSEMQAYLRAKISKHLQLTEKTGLGNVVNAAADQLAEGWEAIEAAYHGFDPDNAHDEAFVALCELTGTKRNGATKGAVLTSCTFAGGTLYPPGALVAHVDGFPDNRWVNRDEVDTTSTPGVHVVLFEAETAGAHGIALAGTLTRIAQPVTGWDSITNAVDATPGADIESLESLALRRVEELGAAGSGPMAAIRGAVSRVSGVLQVRSQENKTDFESGGIPPHGFRIIVWDGVSPAADDDEIAQAILDAAPGGIPTYGSNFGVAVDDDGLNQVINFDRAIGMPVYINVDVDGSTVGVSDAILKEAAKLRLGSTVVREKLKGAASVLPGVNDVVSFTLGLTPAPVGTSNIVMAVNQFPLFDASRISVS